MTFLEKLELLMKERNIKNIKRLSEELKMPRSTIDAFYKQGYSNMKLSTFKKLCDYFVVTMDSMARDEIGEIEDYDPNRKDFYISEEEKYIVSKYRTSDDLDKSLVYRALHIDEEDIRIKWDNEKMA